ncbi:hypothetical protein KY386_02665 [Candidatus Parcubacteria bacterium]|nr:hypothetical protein [Candidatus Parcubacteria bacterium]
MSVNWPYIITLTALIGLIVVLVGVLVSRTISNIYGAPWVAIGRGKLARALLRFGGLSDQDTFFDLGCGDGRVLAVAVRDCGVKKAVGFEVAPWPYLRAKLKVAHGGLGGRVELYRSDFLKADMSGATFVYAYLFPKLLDRLAAKLSNELKAGTKVLCPSFTIDTAVHSAFRLVKTGQVGKTTVYLYEKV